MAWWSNLWRTRAQDWVFAWLEGKNVPDGAMSGVVESEKRYLSVFLKSAHITDVRKGLTKFYGTVHSHIRLAHRSEGTAEFNVVTTPSDLKDVDARAIDRIIQFNKRLLGPVPYAGGDLELEVGLFSIPSGDLVAPYLELVESMSDTAGVAYVSAALPLAGAIVQGVKLLATGGSSADLEIGLATTLQEPRLGYCAAVRAPKHALSPKELRVDPADFRLLSAKGPVTEYPYIVLEIRADARRDDWFKIPELATASQRIQREYRDGRPAAVADALVMFKRIALTCNDLIDDDARNLVQKLHDKYAQIGPTPDASRGSHVPRPTPPDLKDIPLYSA